ncbi:MAG: ABC transporter substrate-binding protein [Motiliproteus sp.]
MRLNRCQGLTFAFALLLCTDGVSAEATSVTVYADDSYPPYSYLEDGTAKGLYTKILQTAFSRMPDYHVKIEAVPWKRGLKLLESGSGFALYPPYMHYKKRPYIWPYSLPILDERVVVYCHAKVMDKFERFLWPEHYYGLTIGINAGFQVGGDEFWEAVNTKKIKVMEVRGNREGLLSLGKRRADCYMNDRLSINLELLSLRNSGEYREGSTHAKLVEGATVTLEQGFLGYTDRDQGKFAYKSDFQKQLDIQIYEMRRTGELQQIMDNFSLEFTLPDN